MVIFTKDFGKIIKKMEKDFYYKPMVIIIMANGKTI